MLCKAELPALCEVVVHYLYRETITNRRFNRNTNKDAFEVF